jgi:hypothetical protein
MLHYSFVLHPQVQRLLAGATFNSSNWSHNSNLWSWRKREKGTASTMDPWKIDTTCYVLGKKKELDFTSLLEYEILVSHSGFEIQVFWDEICALLGYYAASNDNLLPTFRDNVSVPSSRIKKSYWISWPLKMVPIRYPETSVKNTIWRCIIPQKSADLINIAAEAWNHVFWDVLL